MENWKIKLGSFAAALFLFWYVQYSRNITRELNIRVNVPEIPKEYVFSSRVPSFVTVRFRGMYDIMDFNVSDFRINLVNTNIQLGENVFEPKLVPDLPDEIQADFQDEEVVIKLDRELNRRVIVEPDYNYISDKKYRIGYRKVTPSTLMIKGPYEIVSEIVKIPTKPVVLEGDGKLLFGKSKLKELPEFVKLDEDFKNDVEVSIQFLEKDNMDSQELQIDNIPIRCLNDIPGLVMKPYGSETVSVRVLSRNQVVGAGDLRVGVYCPVFYDSVAKEIKPSYIIDDIYVIAEGKHSPFDILEVVPEKVNLQFEISRKAVPGAIQKGFKEHVIP